jgi:hypothetical protein
MLIVHYMEQISRLFQNNEQIISTTQSLSTAMQPSVEVRRALVKSYSNPHCGHCKLVV